MPVEIKEVKGTDEEIRQHDLAVQLAMAVKGCSLRQVAELQYPDLIQKFQKEHVLYLIGRLEEFRRHQLQGWIEKLTALRELLSWYQREVCSTARETAFVLREVAGYLAMVQSAAENNDEDSSSRQVTVAKEPNGGRAI